jgi:hypothetical protein
MDKALSTIHRQPAPYQATEMESPRMGTQNPTMFTRVPVSAFQTSVSLGSMEGPTDRQRLIEEMVWGLLRVLISFLEVLGHELRAYTMGHCTSPFCDWCFIFFEIGSHRLFAWAVFEPQSS